MTTVATLAGFLLARIADDEAFGTHDRYLAKRWDAECQAKRRIVTRHTQKVGANLPRHPICAECGGADWRPEGGVLQPFPWVMPWPCHTLRALALPYADHPDYRQEWKP